MIFPIVFNVLWQMKKVLQNLTQIAVIIPSRNFMVFFFILSALWRTEGYRIFLLLHADWVPKQT
jgi:hypothetical protein